MFERRKLWVGLGAALLTGTSLATGAWVAAAQAAGAPPEIATGGGADRADTAPWTGVQLAAGEGGEGDEGGEGGAAADLTRSDSAYLTQLGLMRGHLSVGIELYRRGEVAAAATHMKHPEDELYAALAPALEKRGSAGFEEELQTLAERVETNAGGVEVEAAYDAVLAAIAKAEGAIANPPAYEIGEVIHNLVRTAAEEYDVAVADGRVVEAHEYQDALGFVRVAEIWLKTLEDAGADGSIVREIGDQIALIRPAWPSVLPPEKAAADPSHIHAAAARIEIATLGLEP